MQIDVHTLAIVLSLSNLRVSQHTEAEFSHGICPDCLQTLYPKYRRKA